MNLQDLLPLLQTHALPLGIAGFGLLVIFMMAGRQRALRRQLRELRDRINEAEESITREQTSLAHCRERLSEQQQALLPIQGQLRALRQLVVVAELGADGHMLGANRRLLRLLGADEGGSLPPWPPGWETAWLTAQPHLGPGKSWQGRVLLRQGEVEVAMLLRIGPLPQPEGEPPRWLAVGSELGALERRQRELLDSLERHAEVFDGLRAGSWHWDLAADRVRLDRRALALLGLPAAGAVQMSADTLLRERLHPEDEAAWQAALQRHLRGQDAALDLPLRLRHADGPWLRLQLRGAAVRRDEAGEPSRLAGVLLPLGAGTDDASAAAEPDLLAQAQLALGQGLLRWRPQADRWTWNAAALSLLQRSPSAVPEPLAQALLVVQAGDRELLVKALQQAASGQAWQGELRLLTALGAEKRLRLQLVGGADEVLGLLLPAPPAVPAKPVLAARPRRLLPAELAQRSADQGLALQRALDRFDGDTALLLRTADDFAASSRGLAARLREVVRADNPLTRREALQALHGFKAVASLLGSEGLARWGQLGEQRLRSGQGLGADWLAEFEAQLREGLDALQQACAELYASAPMPLN